MIHLIKDENEKVIGWELVPNTEEEQIIAAHIRNLQFFGYDDTAIVYNGVKLLDVGKDKTLGNIKSISWIQKKHESK